MLARMRNREHASFRREATFKAEAYALEDPILDPIEPAVRREDLASGVYVLHGLMTVRECKRLIAAADARGFTHAGLAIGDDTYRVNLAARNNLRVVLDAPTLAAGLWPRLRHLVDPHHEGAPVRAVNTRFRVYRYEPGQRFAPHVDVRTVVPGGETRYSLMIYLSDEFTDGATRFFEQKDRSARRGQGRARKFDNRVRFAVRPPIGDAVVFDHLLLHEGAEVTAGIKYAVRTDLVHAR